MIPWLEQYIKVRYMEWIIVMNKRVFYGEA